MKKTIFFSVLIITTSLSGKLSTPNNTNKESKSFSPTLLYDNVWGTYYNAVPSQCDDTPLTTGDGSKINPKKASEHRWIAISQYMLNDERRRGIIDTTKDMRFNGKIRYGDTVVIVSPFPKLNGSWVVRDTKNKRYNTPTVDFLQSENDKSIYNNDPLWCGKWEDIKIYKN